MTANPLAGVIGSPISGGLLGLRGAGLAGWQWMFLLEGLPVVIVGFVMLKLLADAARNGGHRLIPDAFFDTITVRVPGRADEIADAARGRRINLRVVDFDTIGIALDETTTIEDVADIVKAFAPSGKPVFKDDTLRPQIEIEAIAEVQFTSCNDFAV
jgi:hypothetical protein